jgi:EpsI family protein
MLGLGAGMGLAAIGAQWARPQADAALATAQPLDAVFPQRFGHWQVDPAAEALIRPSSGRRVHGIYDQVLERTYVHTSGARVMLLAAEGAEQSVGLQVHRPEICYPGNGFRVHDLHRAALLAGARHVPCTRLHASMPGRSEPLTYWVLLDGRAVPDEHAFRWQQLRLGLRRRLASGLLVRLSTIEPQAKLAYALHSKFALELGQALPASASARIFGS